MQRVLQRKVVCQFGKQALNPLGRFQQTEQCARGSASVTDASEPASSSGRGREATSLLWLAVPGGAAAILGTSYARQEQTFWELAPAKCLNSEWVQQMAAQDDNKVVLSAATLQQHPLLKRDHMFSELHRHDMVEDLVCFYNAPEKSLSCVIQLGKNVCGFPRIMHGGLTAAIIDESFGFLWLSLRSNRQLPFWGPAFTAHLEVDYKQKIPAGRLLLCTTEVESCEGRKLWMKATVRDGPTGKVYATARTLFVSPNTQKLIQEGWKYAYQSLIS